MIGHANNDGRLGRNHLLGHDGNGINALLAAAGQNLRLILQRIRFLFVRILSALYGAAAKTDTSLNLRGLGNSIA